MQHKYNDPTPCEGESSQLPRKIRQSQSRLHRQASRSRPRGCKDLNDHCTSKRFALSHYSTSRAQPFTPRLVPDLVGAWTPMSANSLAQARGSTDRTARPSTLAKTREWRPSSLPYTLAYQESMMPVRIQSGKYERGDLEMTVDGNHHAVSTIMDLSLPCRGRTMITISLSRG